MTSHPLKKWHSLPSKVTKIISTVLHCPQGQMLQEKMAGSSHDLSIILSSNGIKLSSTWFLTDRGRKGDSLQRCN